MIDKTYKFTNCIDCEKCENCKDCVLCTDCKKCTKCVLSTNLQSCRYQFQCESNINCLQCYWCTNCDQCLYCHGCTNCKYCIGAWDISDKQFIIDTHQYESLLDWMEGIFYNAQDMFDGDLMEKQSKWEEDNKDLYDKLCNNIPQQKRWW